MSLSSPEIWVWFASFHPEQLHRATAPLPAETLPSRQEQLHGYEKRQGHVLPPLSQRSTHPTDVGKGCRGPKLATGFLFLVGGPNPAFLCVPNSGVSWASPGWDPAELDPPSLAFFLICTNLSGGELQRGNVVLLIVALPLFLWAYIYIFFYPARGSSSGD